MIVAVVLAAGGSTRLGRPKMTLPLRQGTVLSAAVEAFLATELERVVVVLGAEAQRVRRDAALPEDSRLCVVVNPDWQAGMSSSLRCGVETARAADAEAILVALGDQPGLSPGRIREVLRAFAPRVRLVVPASHGVPAHPVLFASGLFDELAALTGDVGAREVIRRHENEAVKIEVEPLPDVDTEEDYRKLLDS